MHPDDAEAQSGGYVFLFSEVQGIAALHAFAWQKNGVPLEDSERIVGSQTSTLAILNIQSSDVGVYQSVATNMDTGCSQTSNPAVLVIPGQCPGDFNGDGQINSVDLAPLLGAWGPNPPGPIDLNDDGIVNPTDLAQVLGSWGPCK